MQFRLQLALLAFSVVLAGQTSPPSLDPAAQKKVLADATEYAMHNEQNLPNFMCMQTTRRFEDMSGKEIWRPIDIVVERLSYFEHHEEYKVFLINGQPASIDHKQLAGASSSGEFGSVMKGIFSPQTEAQFEWKGWFTLRGRRMHVMAYQVSAAKSSYHILVPNERLDLTAAYHGLVFIDDYKHFVHRITLHPDGIPPSFPVQDVSLALDYDYAQIGGTSYLLPLEFELRSREGRRLVKNDVNYTDYRKFGADSSITFDSEVKK